MAQHTGSCYLRRDPFELPSCRPMSRKKHQSSFPTMLNRLPVKKAMTSERSRRRRGRHRQVRRIFALEKHTESGKFSWPFTQPPTSDPQGGLYHPQGFEVLRTLIDAMGFEILYVHIISPSGPAFRPPDAHLRFLSRCINLRSWDGPLFCWHSVRHSDTYP